MPKSRKAASHAPEQIQRGIWLLSREQVDTHMVCKGAGDSLLRFDKKVIPGNGNSVKTRRSTARVAEAAEAGGGEPGIGGRGKGSTR